MAGSQACCTRLHVRVQCSSGDNQTFGEESRWREIDDDIPSLKLRACGGSLLLWCLYSGVMSSKSYQSLMYRLPPSDAFLGITQQVKSRRDILVCYSHSVIAVTEMPKQRRQTSRRRVTGVSSSNTSTRLHGCKLLSLYLRAPVFTVSLFPSPSPPLSLPSQSLASRSLHHHGLYVLKPCSGARKGHQACWRARFGQSLVNFLGGPSINSRIPEMLRWPGWNTCCAIFQASVWSAHIPLRYLLPSIVQ